MMRGLADKVQALADYVSSGKRLQRCYGRVFGSKDGVVILEDLRSHFEVGLPCFQGEKGSFDSLDAMRRDAYREVLLYVELMVSRSNVNKQQIEIEDDDQ